MRAGILAAAAVLVLGLAAPAVAQTQGEMNAQAQASAMAADAKLNKAYQALIATLDPPARAALTRAELKWIAFRDAECAFKAGFHEGGSIQPLIRWGAYETLTKARTAQLRARSAGRPDPGADAELNRLYQELVRDLDAQSRKRLQAAEVAWIGFRDAEAAFQARRFGTALAGPLADLTKARSRELQEAINAGEERP